MARKPEAVFVGSVHKHLDKAVYRVGMANPYTGGIPDQYYEGSRSELWVEYKFYPKLPPILDLLNRKARTKLSGLQETWLKRAYGNGRNVAVILGTPDGGIIFHNLSWQIEYERDACVIATRSRKDIAEWIYNETMGSQ